MWQTQAGSHKVVTKIPKFYAIQQISQYIHQDILETVRLWKRNNVHFHLSQPEAWIGISIIIPSNNSKENQELIKSLSFFIPYYSLFLF